MRTGRRLTHGDVWAVAACALVVVVLAVAAVTARTLVGRVPAVLALLATGWPVALLVRSRGRLALLTTAGERAEQDAAENARRLRLLADSVPVLVWRTDAGGRIDYVSNGLLDYTGTPPEAILGDAWVGVLHPDDRDRAVEAWTRTVTTGAPYFVEFRIRRHDGQHRWHLTQATADRDDAGTVVAWWGSCIDVQDRQEFRRRSQDLAARLTWTLESVSDAVVGLDPAGRVSVMNERAAALLGRPREQLVGRIIWEEFPEAVGGVFQEQLDLAAATREPVRFDAAYAVGRHLEVSAYPHDQGLTVYFRDVTETRRTAERLAHVQRMESLGQLTGGVAHDFNNLLTVVVGNADVLSRRLADDPSLLRLADSIAAAGQRGAELTHSLLAFARRQPLHPTVVDVNELVRDTVRLLGRTLGGGIRVQTSLAPGDVPCLVDRVQLENAVLNLCINARDAMPDGGRLRLETGRTTLGADRADQDHGVVPGEYVTVTVADDGTGIATEHLERVFEPFFTTKESGKGSGLGLAMVYGFARQSHGDVTVESHPGAGTTVRLLLPLAPEPVLETAGAERP